MVGQELVVVCVGVVCVGIGVSVLRFQDANRECKIPPTSKLDLIKDSLQNRFGLFQARPTHICMHAYLYL